MELGERLYQLRRERRMSQEALADALGVSRQSVSKWENGASTPDLDKLVRLGELFGLSLDELVKGQAPPTAEGTEAAVRPPCSKGRMIAAVVLLVCGGLAALLLFATTLLYFAVWLLLAGVLCLRAREHLGILLGGTAWLFALLFFETGTVLSPWDIFSPAAYRFYPPFYLLLDWLAFLPFLLLLGLAVRAAWGRFDRSSLMRLGLAAALFFAARVVCGLLNHSLLASSLLE
ncbi:MAG: helix-turn-helix domain-containing protein, partial [Flavonifractor plautii]